jgi:Na+/H+ antiporter NhaD/arsenite permease-like protein
MGANTYIGNAPNFMVKSICEEREINMPSFFGYMVVRRHPFAALCFADHPFPAVRRHGEVAFP